MRYLHLIETSKVFRAFDKWFPRRLRNSRCKRWKLPRTRSRMLRSLGRRRDLAYQWGNASRAYWRIAKNPILHHALSTQYWQEQGTLFFYDAWLRFRPNG